MAGWAALTLVTDADLGNLEPQATDSAAPWGQTTWPRARAEAKRELKILIETSFGREVRSPADRVLDVRQPDYLLSYDGSTYTDHLTEGVDREEDDLALGTILNGTTPRIYLGADYPFEGIAVLMTGTRNAAAATLTVKYSGPAGWTDLEAVDGTKVSTATLGKSGRILWGIPADWQRESVDTAEGMFWVELSVSAALTAGVTATQLLPIMAPDGLRRVAALLSLSYVLNGLERQAAKPEDWREKAAYYREQGLALFQLLKEQGGIPIDSNRDEVIQAAELVDTTPVRLRRG